MKDNFLESDSLSGKRIVVFGINHMYSEPTINHIKQINALYPDFLSRGIDQVYCVSFSVDPMHYFLMDKLSKNIQFVQQPIEPFRLLLNKKGHRDFLHQYWQFACVLNNGQVEYYIEQPFTKVKVLADTNEQIYSKVNPLTVLNVLQ